MKFDFSLNGLENISSFKPTEDRLFALESIESELLGFDSEIQMNEAKSGFEGVYFDSTTMISGMEALFRRNKKEEKKDDKQDVPKQKEGIFKRIWEAIKALFKKLGGYGKAVWKWFKSKMTNGFQKVKSGLLAIICKVSWLRKLCDWVADKFKGKPLKEVQDERVAEFAEVIAKNDEKELRKLIADKKIANWGAGPESVEYSVGTEGILDWLKGIWESIKNWVIRVFTGKKKEILQKDPEAEAQKVREDIVYLTKLPKFTINLGNSARINDLMKKKISQLSALDAEQNPRGGVWMLNYAVLLGYSLEMFNNDNIKLGDTSSAIKQEFTYEEVNKLIPVLTNRYIDNFQLQRDRLLPSADKDDTRPDDFKTTNIADLYITKGFKDVFTYFDVIQKSAEWHDKIFNTDFEMYTKLVEKDPQIMLPYFAADFDDQQKRQMLVMEVIRLNQRLVKKFVEVSKEVVADVTQWIKDWNDMQDKIKINDLQKEAREQFGED